MDLGGFVIPEAFVILLLLGKATHILWLLKVLNLGTPTWSSEFFSNEIYRLREVSPVAHMAVHSYLMLSSHLVYVSVVN